MNHKDERIKKLWVERGLRDVRVIAKKLGYNGDSIDTVGIERVREGLLKAKLISDDYVP